MTELILPTFGCFSYYLAYENNIKNKIHSQNLIRKTILIYFRYTYFFFKRKNIILEWNILSKTVAKWRLIKLGFVFITGNLRLLKLAFTLLWEES